MEITRIGDITTGWGESVLWDDRTQRLYFVDCLASTLHWLDGGDAGSELRTMAMPSMPTGIVPTEDGRLIAVLEDGLHAVDVDGGTTELLTPFPAAIGGRCNDACADLDGNVITGKLNLGPDEGSAWRWSPATGTWTLLDPDIANTNGPAVAVIDGEMTLVIGDTSADYFAYGYDPKSGTVGARRVFAGIEANGLAGRPDGATVDADCGFWCALVGGGQLARFTTTGLDRTIAVPAANPTDVTFGGARLDRLFVTTIDGPGEHDGALLAIDGVGVTGRPEPRASLAAP